MGKRIENAGILTCGEKAVEEVGSVKSYKSTLPRFQNLCTGGQSSSVEIKNRTVTTRKPHSK